MAKFNLYYGIIDLGTALRASDDDLDKLIQKAEEEICSWDSCHIEYASNFKMAWEPSLGKETVQANRPSDFNSPEWWFGLYDGMWHQQPC